MPNIIKHPNFYVIEDVKPHSYEMKNTTYNFAVWNKVYYKFESQTFKLIDGNIHIPGSVPVEYVKQLYPGRQVIEQMTSYPKPRKISYKMKYGSKNDLQRECEEFLLDYARHDTAQKYIGLVPGSGKTFLAIQAISQLKVSAMIVVNQTYLAEQWKNEFLKHSDISADEVVILSGFGSVAKEMEAPKKAKVYIAIHRTLGNMVNQDLTLINEMNVKLGIGLRIFDEGHLEFTNICQINNVSSVKYTLYLSATPDRSSFEEHNMFGKIFKSIPYYTGEHLKYNKYHQILLYKYNTEPTERELKSVNSKFGFNRNVWAANVMGDDASVKIFKDSVIDVFTRLKLHVREKKIAIILPTIKMIETITELLNKTYPQLISKAFVGETPKDQRADVLKSDIIVTNEKMFATGVDVKGLEIVINYVPIGNLINIEQTAGRLRNLTADEKVSIFIDATDYGYPDCIKQLTMTRMKYYNKVAKSIKSF